MVPDQKIIFLDFLHFLISLFCFFFFFHRKNNYKEIQFIIVANLQEHQIRVTLIKVQFCNPYPRPLSVLILLLFIKDAEVSQKELIDRSNWVFMPNDVSGLFLLSLPTKKLSGNLSRLETVKNNTGLLESVGSL